MWSERDMDRKRKAREAFERKQWNRDVINDTLVECARDESLNQLCPYSKHHWPGVWRAEGYVTNPMTNRIKVSIRNEDCVLIAEECKRIEGAKVWLLNMASAYKPGGGVLGGSNAQEEHLCRCSNLLPHLRYAANEKDYPLHFRRIGNDSPDFNILAFQKITFFKNPTDYSLRRREDRFVVGVLTAAAENVSKDGSRKQLGPNAERFIECLLETAVKQECTHLVLSAWGCGAFGQCPYAVAECFQRFMTGMPCTIEIVFAIVDDHNSDDNLAAFQTVFRS